MASKKFVARKSSIGASSSIESFDSTRFQTLSDFQKFVTLIKYRSIQNERLVVLDELSSSIGKNFESKCWLSIYSNLVSPPAAIIREFYSNLSVHSTITGDHFLATWFRGSEYQITRQDVSNALSVPIVVNPIYPYVDLRSLDDVVSILYDTPMVWTNEPRLDTGELIKDNYLLYRIACHNIFPMSHIHTVPTLLSLVLPCVFHLFLFNLL